MSCAKGAIHDVIVDLRPDSESFRHWQEFELSAANRHQLYVPLGFAHGFQTLEDDTRNKLSDLDVLRFECLHWRTPRRSGTRY